MTYHVVDRGADRLRKTTIIERCRDRLLFVNDVVVTDAVKFIGGYTGFYVGADHLQDLAAETSGNTHFVNFIGGFYGNRHLRS